MLSLDEFLQQWHDGNDRLLVCTSGSTGTPKPLWVEKSRMVESARMTLDFLSLREGDTALLCLPLDYIAGKMMVVRAEVGGLRLIDVKPGSHPLAGLSPRHIDFAAMVPMQVACSLQVEQERRQLESVRHLIIGGGAVDESLEEQLQTFPNAVWSTYGMTETLSHIALRRLNGPTRSQWYTPLPGVSVSLNHEGCLVVDAPAVAEARLVTNDLGELHDGMFRILGRKDNVVCSGGLKIQMEETERLLRPHLAAPFLITKCADPVLGEAVVLLTEDSDTEACRRVCEAVLPRHHRPRHILSTARIPMTDTGKPARAEALRLVSELLG